MTFLARNCHGSPVYVDTMFPGSLRMDGKIVTTTKMVEKHESDIVRRFMSLEQDTGHHIGSFGVNLGALGSIGLPFSLIAHINLISPDLIVFSSEAHMMAYRLMTGEA